MTVSKFMNYPQKLQIDNASYGVVYQPVLRTTSSIRIKNGKVVLKLSRFAYGAKRDEIVRKFLKWAEKRLSKVAGNDFINPVYEDGGRIVTHNKIYDLNVVAHAGGGPGGQGGYKSKARLKNGNLIRIEIVSGLTLSAAKKTVQNLSEKLIIKDQTPYLCEVLNELNQLYFQENFVNCRFKRTRSRFGSCSTKRNINISFRLLFAPREIFRYVCVHELAHLKEFNHSKEFWSLVESAMPDYKNCEKWLKNNGFLLG
jgi:predicted metal-dependent hydrolase